VRQLTNASGAVTDSYEYDAFGNEISSTGSTPNEMLYRGEQFDPDLGLYYLRARYYNPLTGRFVSRDPKEQCSCEGGSGSFSLNKYLYASTDPVDRIDPSGRADVEDEAEIDLNITQNAIGQKAKIAAIGFGAGAAGGTGLWALSAAIVCQLHTDAATIQALTQNLGFAQKLEFYASGCTASSSRLPHIPPLGNQPAPFNPWDVITAPGTPWKCTDDNDDLECEAPCPPGSKRDYRKLHWDDGRKTGEPPHWDYTDCNGDTWKIYLDGTMGPG